MAKTPHDLTLERITRLGRDMAALTESIGSMTRMFALQHADITARLDRLEEAQRENTKALRSFAGEVITLANQIINANQSASQAHQRIDELQDPLEGDAP